MGNKRTPHGGSVNRDPVRLVDADAVLNDSDCVIEGDCTAAEVTIDLPTAASCKGWSYVFIKVDNTAHALVLDPAGIETIAGESSYSLQNENDEVVIESDGVSWIITSFYSPLIDPNSPNFSGVPAGVIMAYGGTVAPEGWDLCDGSSKLRAGAYAALFAVIGTAYGAADGTHFNLPDFRGRFLRGVDGGAGRDPDTLTRIAMNAGGNAGDAVGSVQGFATAEPNNAFTVPTDDAAGADPNSLSLGVAADGTRDVSGGDAETRPINAYVNYIIKH